MTATRMVFLTCDGLDGQLCIAPDTGTTADYSDAETVAEARAQAVRLGWVRFNGRDICERCRDSQSPA